MINHIPNPHNISWASNLSKSKVRPNSGVQSQTNCGLTQNNISQANTSIGMSKDMVSTKINGLNNLNILKKKTIEGRKCGDRLESKSSFGSDLQMSKRPFFSNHSRDGSSNKKRELYNPSSQTMNNSIHSNRSMTTSPVNSEEKLKRFKEKMEQQVKANIDPKDTYEISDPL